MTKDVIDVFLRLSFANRVRAIEEFSKTGTLKTNTVRDLQVGIANLTKYLDDERVKREIAIANIVLDMYFDKLIE